MDGARITIDAHESEPYSWTMVHRAPHVGLVDDVLGYSGYVERSTLPLRRREVANGAVVLIFSFGERIDVQLSSDRELARHLSFVAGVHDGFVITQHGGRQHGVEVDLTPLGAYRLLGVPPSELAHSVTAIQDIGSDRLSGLADRLATAPDWPARFDLLDREFLRRAAEGPEPDPAIAWAWRQLADAHGRVAVGVLAEEIGWSRRHFVARFRHDVGLAPKAAARVLRFHRASQLLTAGDAHSISAVAAACGYADHSHLVREFHDLAGCTPSALIGAQLPDGGGITG